VSQIPTQCFSHKDFRTKENEQYSVESHEILKRNTFYILNVTIDMLEGMQSGRLHMKIMSKLAIRN